VIAFAAALLLATGGGAPDSALWTSTESAIAAGTVVATLALMPLDERILDVADDTRTGVSRGFAAAAKPMGDGIVTVPVAGALWWLGADGRFPRLARASRNGLESWLLSGLVVQVGKYSLDRERPSDVDGASRRWHGFTLSDRNLSMPSGHSTVAWAMLSSYAMEFSDRPWLAASLYAVAASTSLSRVHDQDHWMSDVVMGAGIGFLGARLVRNWNARRDARTAVVPSWSNGRSGVTVVSVF
jgi:membrane-associated phospholipid phosphatase